MTSAVLAFTIAAALLALTPGADTALVLRASVRGGRPEGLGAVLGISTGVLTWGFASGAGLSALLSASPAGYQLLRWAGAAYLGYLGLRSLLRRVPDAAMPASPSHPDPAAPDPAQQQSTWQQRPTWRAGARAGLVTNLLNPKIGVFYAAFLPQFVPHGAPVLAMSVGLTLIHVTLGTAWLSVVVITVDRARAVLGRPAVRRRMERITGVVLLGFGVRLALAHA